MVAKLLRNEEKSVWELRNIYVITERIIFIIFNLPRDNLVIGQFEGGSELIPVRAKYEMIMKLNAGSSCQKILVTL